MTGLARRIFEQRCICNGHPMMIFPGLELTLLG